VPNRYRTEDFATLYGVVTRHIAAAVTDLEAEDRSVDVNPSYRWVRYLTLAFQQQFEDWEHDRDLAHYMDGLETWERRPVHPAIRLAGHVYLHIGYDLPRSIAVTLGAATASMNVPSMRDTLVDPPPVNVPRADRSSARILFLQATPAFDRALLSSEGLAVLRRAGFPVHWLRLWGARRQRAALEVIGQWAIALRGIAWMHAEILADEPSANLQRAHVERLLTSIKQAQDAITRRTRLMDVRLFRAPVIAQLAPPIGFAIGTVVAVVLTLFAVGGMLTLLFSTRNQRIVAAIDALGHEIHRRLSDPALAAELSTDSNRR